MLYLKISLFFIFSIQVSRVILTLIVEPVEEKKSPSLKKLLQDLMTDDVEGEYFFY